MNGYRCMWKRHRPSTLAEIAPRLFKAQQQLREERMQERAWRRWHAQRDLRLMWLVDHRELQLARAGSTRSARYINERQGKLRRARLMLAAHRRLVFPETRAVLSLRALERTA